MPMNQQQKLDNLVEALWSSGVLPVWLIALAFPLLFAAWLALRLSRTPYIDREDEARSFFPMTVGWVLAAVLVGAAYTAHSAQAGAFQALSHA